ncbi:MAG TPA: PA0069 family radical SAM protein [Tepidisphaeraceae bacterium]|nr:PA0069 family radical SAM protein [Tepidisphaeraceae bacterium]
MRVGEVEQRDGLVSGPARRRGAGLNPGNRFEKIRLHVLGEERERQRVEQIDAGLDPNAAATNVPVEVIADHTQTIINRVAPTSDVPFDWTLNPYRGCEHGCIYCFARPYHEYLGYSCGLDFETKIVAKHDAAALLRRELANPRWPGEPIVMSAITDIYQPIEHKLKIARQCLEVMAECGQAVSTMTKGALVLRDVDLWQKLGAQNAGRVTITLVTLDDELAKKLEPRAASPLRRLHVLRELVKAKVPVSVNIAPVIPGLTDTELPAIMQAVADAGATRVAWILLRLPYQLKDLFLDWLQRSVHPSRATHIESLIRQSRGGKLYEASRARYHGKGKIVEQLAQTFDVFCRKYGLNRDVRPLNMRAFRRPALHAQMSLFDGG